MPLLSIQEDGFLAFDEPLVEGVVVSRPNRFIIEADIDGQLHRTHCPTTGRIGNFSPVGRPILLSASDNPNRSTSHTVEAISLDMPENPHKSWIGVNQNAANRYVEMSLMHHQLAAMHDAAWIQTEVGLGDSRIDFLLDHRIFLEVKTPLNHLQVDLPDHLEAAEASTGVMADRMLRQLRDMTADLEEGQRVILLMCFLYDNPGFRVPPGTQQLHHGAGGLCGPGFRLGAVAGQLLHLPRGRADGEAAGGHPHLPGLG